MKVLVLGANGMLGHKIAERFSPRFETVGSVRGDASSFRELTCFRGVRLVGAVDALTPSVENLVRDEAPDVVINAIGVVKQDVLGTDADACDKINHRLPHRIAEACSAVGARFIGISTDCVFSGTRGAYSEEDVADAADTYGVSKLKGEIRDGNALTVRTSIIGRELAGCQGLVEWFLSNRGGKVRGFRNAIFSGFPTCELADILAGIVTEFPNLSGLYHVSSSAISKLDLLMLLNEMFEAGTEIEEDTGLVIDRSLDSTRFRAATGFEPRPWKEMIEALVRDSAEYERWRTR